MQERRSEADRLSVTTPDRADPVVYGPWHQAPVVATADWPAELYVESQSELRSVLRSRGVTPATAVGQLTGRNTEIGIRRVLGSSNVGIASVDVDRLRSDQHHRVQMRRQCIKSVEQC